MMACEVNGWPGLIYSHGSSSKYNSLTIKYCIMLCEQKHVKEKITQSSTDVLYNLEK